jgi:hypothetical protein
VFMSIVPMLSAQVFVGTPMPPQFLQIAFKATKP